MGFRAARGAEAVGTTSLVTVRPLAAELPELLAGIVGEVEPVVAVLINVEQGDPARAVPVAKEEGVLGDAGGAEEGLESDAAWGKWAGHVVRSVTAGRQDRRLWSVGRIGSAAQSRGACMPRGFRGGASVRSLVSAEASALPPPACCRAGRVRHP